MRYAHPRAMALHRTGGGRDPRPQSEARVRGPKRSPPREAPVLGGDGCGPARGVSRGSRAPAAPQSRTRLGQRECFGGCAVLFAGPGPLESTLGLPAQGPEGREGRGTRGTPVAVRRWGQWVPPPPSAVAVSCGPARFPYQCGGSCNVIGGRSGGFLHCVHATVEDSHAALWRRGLPRWAHR